MILNIRITAARLTALLVLAALLGAWVQAAMATEQTLTMSMGSASHGSAIRELGTDPSIYKDLMPGLVGSQAYHYYSHFSPLISMDGDANIIPWMAESYDVSDDHKSINFHLRKGVKFADGMPVNASVIKFNFDRVLTYGYAQWGITSNLDTFKYYAHSETPDDYTFSLYFNKSCLDIPIELAAKSVYGLFISPWDVEPAWDIKGVLKPEKKYNGLGPYYVDENESIPNEKVVLKKRGSWRDDQSFHKPKLDKIVLTQIVDPQTAVMALEKGDIDYICRYWNAPLDSLRQLEGNPKITIKTYPETATYWICTAWWKEPFNGTEGILLRKAINYALNREEIAKGAFGGYALPATDSMVLSPLRPDVPKCCNNGYDYNLDKAKKLLSEAGWNDIDGDGILDKDGKALKGLNFIITSSTDLIWQKEVALMVQSQLKKIGIDVNIRSLEWSAYSDTFKTGDFDLKLSYNMGRYNPTAQEIRGFNLKEMYGIYLNHYSNQNETLGTAVTKVQNAISTKERNDALCQACNIIYEEAAVIPIVHQVQYAVMNSKVKGFTFGPSAATYYHDHVEECSIED